MIYLVAPPESRRMSRVDKGVKLEFERDVLHKVDPIREDECPVDDPATCPVNEGDKTQGERTDVEMNDEKTDGDKTEDGDKIKEATNKDKKIWMEYADFCKCFRSENFTACSCVNTHTVYGLTLATPKSTPHCNFVIRFWSVGETLICNHSIESC